MKLRHYDHDGRARFVTFCTHRRQPVLTNDQYRGIIAQAITAERNDSGFSLLAYVFMPEHVHLVILPKEESRVGEIIGEIKRTSARAIHELLISHNSPLLPQLTVTREEVTRFALWQRRCFDHNCRTTESVRKMVEYCHFNPVIRGLVREPTDWRWSSSRWYSGFRDGPLEIDVIGTEI